MAFLLNKLMGKSEEVFPYDIQQHTGDVGLFAIHRAIKKADSSVVSVLIFDKVRDSQYLALGNNAFLSMKKLRHPCCIAYLDGRETADKIYVVTEEITSLHTKLRQLDDYPGALSWGIYCVARAVHFLNSECSLVHGNVTLSNVVVNKAGDWKLAGMELLTDPSKGGPLRDFHNLMPDHYKPPELERDFWAGLSRFPRTYDPWLVGCLVAEVFHHTFHGTSTLKDLTPLPSGIRGEYKELLAPHQRRTMDNLLGSRYFKNDYVQSMMFLEHISLKDSYEKDGFFKKLPALVEALPGDVARYKVLPELVKGLDYGTANFRVLAPLLQIAGELAHDEYEAMIAPSVVRWFSNPDRSLRLNLLKNMSTFVENLPASTINDDIFKHVAEGFTDKSPVLREMTVRSILILAPKLKAVTLETQVLRHFAKLQVDPEAGIRANTTLCLGKLAPHLGETTRKKVLAQAFVRALKDAFPPSRLAGVMSLATTSAEYPVKTIATVILPALSLRTIDPDAKVRTETFKALAIFVELLQKQHNSMSDEQYVKEATADENDAGVLGWASGLAGRATSHVTALAANKVLGTPMPKPKPPPVVYAKEHVDSMAASVAKEAEESRQKAASARVSARPVTNEPPRMERKVVAVSDGWGSDGDMDADDGWGSMEDDDADDDWSTTTTTTTSLPPLKTSPATKPQAAQKPTLGSMMSQPKPTPAAAPPTFSSFGAPAASTAEPDWGSLLGTPASSSASSLSSTLSDNFSGGGGAAADDGWGDLSALSGVGTSSSSSSSSSKSKKKKKKK